MVAGRHNLSRRAVLGAGVAACALSAAAATGPIGPSAEAETAAAPEPRRSAAPRIDIICGKCGSPEVSRDAWANWDTDEQDWVLGSVFDYGHCHVCDDEVRLEEVALGGARAEESPGHGARQA